MVVFVVQNVPRGLRGELTRWLLELRAGVFVGDVSALVRDKLWEKVCDEAGEGEAILVYGSDNEQGFALRFWQVRDREIVDCEGLYLIRTTA
mgnify:CR=1 FL=1